MEIIFQKDELQKVLFALQGIAGVKSTLPILTHTLVEAQDGEVKFTATNLEISIRYILKTKVVQEGCITLPLRKVIEIVREVSGNEVRFLIKDGKYSELTSGRAIFKLMGYPVEDFPKMPSSPQTFDFKIPQQTLKEMLRKTIYAASREQTRYVLTGVLFSLSKGILKIVATDRHRLALIEEKLAEESLSDRDFIVPASSLGELVKLLSDTQDLVEVATLPNSVFFKFGNILFTSRLLEGKYPNYKVGLPPQSPKKVILNTQETLRILRRVSLLVSQQRGNLNLNLEKNKLKFTANTPEIGSSYEEAEVEYNQEPLEVIYNAKYLIEAVSNFKEENFIFEIAETNSAAVLKTSPPGNYLQIIMPMRL